MLLSFVAFSGSASANVDSRKSVDRETIVKQNLPVKKRSISFQQARHFLIALEFFKNADQISLLYSAPQYTRASQTILRANNIRKSFPPEIDQALQLHAPRSADLIS